MDTQFLNLIEANIPSRSSSDHRLGGGADYEFNSLPGHEERSSVQVVASGANCIDEDRIETPVEELNCSGRPQGFGIVELALHSLRYHSAVKEN